MEQNTGNDTPKVNSIKLTDEDLGQLVEKSTAEPKTEPKAEPKAEENPAFDEAAAAGVAVRQPDNRTQVRPVKLQNFDHAAILEDSDKANFELIQNVPLEISVEVGRAKKPVRDILSICEGSIIELNKQAGDPVDVIVNGRLLAHGEVVVIDENFGVRITEIVNERSNDE